MALILTKSQAEAVYSAMCALNNVIAACTIRGLGIDRNLTAVLRYDESFEIRNFEGDAYRTLEEYPDQSAFATAYGLQP